MASRVSSGPVSSGPTSGARPGVLLPLRAEERFPSLPVGPAINEHSRTRCLRCSWRAPLSCLRFRVIMSNQAWHPVDVRSACRGLVRTGATLTVTEAGRLPAIAA